MNVRTQTYLWAAQRLTAMFLAFFVFVHLGVIIYAVHQGLSAAHILARTRGNVLWGAFYFLFVASVAVHGPIGLRNVLSETFGWRGASLDWFVALVGIGLAILGWRAVWGVFA